jgi:hypothetical protein
MSMAMSMSMSMSKIIENIYHENNNNGVMKISILIMAM